MSRNSGKTQRVVRHSRVRKKVTGTTKRPRLSVYRSLKNIYAQVIDDESGRTVASASSLEPNVKNDVDDQGKMGLSQSVGQLIAKRAKEIGIETVVFDRGGYKFHGRVKAVADAAREEGLVF
jgi:large subunit ribosomal protein L18